MKREFATPPPAVTVLVAALLLTRALHGQEVPASQANPAADSVIVTNQPPPPASAAAKSEVDAPIEYSAADIEIFVPARLIVLTGRAVVKYKTATLTAGRITVDMERRTLRAEPLPDSLRPASAPAPGAANGRAASDLPTFTDGGDKLVGEAMEFNFATEKGRVLRGRTEFDGGHYFGERIKRVDDRTLNVGSGTYTTCDRNPNPHFHFWSERMKITVQDKVVAKPVVFFLGRIPLAILPFAVFPTKTGRHSGLLIPKYGQSTLEGRFLRDLGYYWAVNDYLDARATVDFYDRSGWLLRGDLTYVKRYAYHGSISGSFTRKNFAFADRRERLWDLRFNHSQPLGESAALAVAGTFTSGRSFYNNFTPDRDRQLTRRLTSQATYSTRLGSNSFSINLSESKDLQDGSYTRTLPNLSFSMPQRPLFGAKKKKAGATSLSLEEIPWYQNLQFSYSGNASFQISRGRAVSNVAPPRQALGRASHALNLSQFSPKYFGWLSLSQSVAAREDWFDRTKRYVVVDTSAASTAQIDAREVRGFFARHTFTYTASANTKLYGTFFPKIGALQAVRHEMAPSVSFFYQPDFSSAFWGYYQELNLPDGSRVKRDRFGGTSQGKLASVSFGLANLFQMKVGSEEKPKKINLFNLGLSTGYNFAARRFKQGPLSSNLQASPGRGVSLSLNAGHSFYDVDSSGIEVKRLLWKKHGLLSGKFLRLTNVSLNASLQLQGETGGSPAPVEVNPPEPFAAGTGTTGPPESFSPFAPPPDGGEISVPWSASVSLSYSLNRANPRRPTKYAQLGIPNARVQLTKNLSLDYSAQFDLVKKSVIYQSYGVHRDLHCWEMRLTWIPGGTRQSFYMSISLKAPLQDIKLEKRGGRASVFGGSYY
ncbi:MAG: putative LPS assembly protein LptD [candidate division KSB1 bacterium]|nr:putative LPS assembly protein LptD [candidate division KSB1 bacterium]MDZ7275750.1 putative LPS assembly protein LptD [candidate division KSB1 bacterium]MDZ7284559.1 putative LPS assembly protein LptD [candidate division KSB1 bacterium]MDZ7298022.1 putative LPS assembly protein LptD [candidate division KSB1 bacterium]MDZ7348887.1 putative LPS assembly protein LptD [candidate division KSB1 bacterium]